MENIFFRSFGGTVTLLSMLIRDFVLRYVENSLGYLYP